MATVKAPAVTRVKAEAVAEGTTISAVDLEWVDIGVMAGASEMRRGGPAPQTPTLPTAAAVRMSAVASTSMGRAVIVLMLVTLSACTGSGSHSFHDRPDPSVLAELIGCRSYTPDVSHELGVVQSGTCDYEGNTLQINVFSDSAAQKKWEKAVAGAGGAHAAGDLWTLYGREGDGGVKQASDALGGRIMP